MLVGELAELPVTFADASADFVACSLLDVADRVRVNIVLLGELAGAEAELREQADEVCVPAR